MAVLEDIYLPPLSNESRIYPNIIRQCPLQEKVHAYSFKELQCIHAEMPS